MLKTTTLAFISLVLMAVTPAAFAKIYVSSNANLIQKDSPKHGSFSGKISRIFVYKNEYQAITVFAKNADNEEIGVSFTDGDTHLAANLLGATGKPILFFVNLEDKRDGYNNTVESFTIKSL
jgi:hypothetical protein